MNAAQLRAQLEPTLGDRFPSRFIDRESIPPETISTGIPELDQLTGGLPQGGLSEICGSESSGRTALLLSVMAEATACGELCALLDAEDALDPHSAAAAGVDLTRLLWVRCHRIEQALRSAELLLDGGGFRVVALDLAAVPVRLMRRVPLSIWFRLRWTVRKTRTALIVLERELTVGSSASLVMRLETDEFCWSQLPQTFKRTASPEPSIRDGLLSHTRLLAGARWNVETLRSRHRFQPSTRASLTARVVWR